MNKKEKEILLNTYKDCLFSKSLGFDKEDTRITLKHMIVDLGLERDLYRTENKFISEQKEYDLIIEDTFNMIFDTFARYGMLINYDLDEIENIYETCLKYKFTIEDENCYKARIKILKERL